MAARIVANGHDDSGLGAGIVYFHTAGELREEVVDAGFVDVRIRAVEGPAWPLIDPACPADDPLIAQVAAIAEMADGDDTLTGASAHLLALGHPAVVSPVAVGSTRSIPAGRYDSLIG